MARAGNSKYRIYQAANELVNKGINPTVRAVRAALGGGGNALITEHLKTWREKNLHVPDEEQGPGNVVEAAISRLYDALVTDIEHKFDERILKQAETLSSAEKLLTAAEEKTSSLLDLVDTLQEHNAKLEAEQEELKGQILVERSHTEAAVKTGAKYKSALDVEERTTSAMSGELNEKTKHVKSLQAETARLVKANEQLQTDKRAESEMLSAERIKYGKLEGDHKTLIQRYEAMTQKTVPALKVELEGIHGKNAKLLTQLEKINVDYVSLKAQLANDCAELTTLRASLSDATHRENDKAKALTTSQEQLTHLLQIVENKDTALQEAQKNIHELKTKLKKTLK
jgi:chromosome segregation ATPase